MAVGDFNGDGKRDLAVVNFACPLGLCSSAGSVSILLGDGTGNFTLTSSPATGGEDSSSVAVGDFNGDGKLDLAVANCATDVLPCNTQTVSVLLGDGAGNFTLAASPSVGTYLTSVAVGDFNGDGKLDLGVVSPYANAVSILLQLPPAVILMPPSLSFGTSCFPLRAGR